MKKILTAILFTAIATGSLAPGVAFSEPVNSINLGLGGIVQTMPHCKAKVYIVEYERMISPTTSVLGRASEVSYKFDDKINYTEEGRPRGIDIGARFYPGGNMRGFFITGVLGKWRSDWRFSHNMGRPDQWSGDGTSDSIRASVDIGGRFQIGSSSVSIMPALNFGKFFSSINCEFTSPSSRVGQECKQSSEVIAYMFLGVTAGVGF